MHAIITNTIGRDSVYCYDFHRRCVLRWSAFAAETRGWFGPLYRTLAAAGRPPAAGSLPRTCLHTCGLVSCSSCRSRVPKLSLIDRPRLSLLIHSSSFPSNSRDALLLPTHHRLILRAMAMSNSVSFTIRSLFTSFVFRVGGLGTIFYEDDVLEKRIPWLREVRTTDARRAICAVFIKTSDGKQYRGKHSYYVAESVQRDERITGLCGRGRGRKRAR